MNGPWSSFLPMDFFGVAYLGFETSQFVPKTALSNLALLVMLRMQIYDKSIARIDTSV